MMISPRASSATDRSLLWVVENGNSALIAGSFIDLVYPNAESADGD